ncbi:hypothetical protein [Veillonella sp.]|uniref:hypothetical protein n=1 Tax=Veillonella sp. TaxID=1926307 RepID=UPI00290FAA0F|nr:hypothetical protein [Veillonella sp.]MDU3433632.1 hypothetical protein [Veillonella sp.]
MKEKIDNIIEKGHSYLNSISQYDEQNVLNLCSDDEYINSDIDEYLDGEQLDLRNFFLYRIDEIVFSKKDGPRREAMENVLSSFRNYQDVNLIYMILGDKDKVNFYIGVSKNLHLQDYIYSTGLALKDYADDILQPSIKGNFVGSTITKIEPKEKERILQRLQNGSYSGLINGIPGFIDENNGEKSDFQGVERLVDTMVGNEFGLVVIATPCKDIDIIQFNRNIIQVHDTLSPLSKYLIQSSESTQTQEGTEENSTNSRAIGLCTNKDSISIHSKSKITGHDHRTDNNKQNNSSKSQTKGIQKSENIAKSSSYADSQNTSENNIKNQNSSSSTNKTKTLSFSNDDSTSYQYNESDSINDSQQWSVTSSESVSDNNSESNNTIDTTQKSFQKSTSINDNLSYSERKSKHDSNSTQFSRSIELEKKSVLNWLKYIDDELLLRVDASRGKGSYSVVSYLFADKTRTTLFRLANSILGLYGGDKGNINPLQFIEFQKQQSKELNNIKLCLSNLQVPLLDSSTPIWKSIFSKITYTALGKECYGTWLNTDELGLLMGMPRKEVLGVSTRDEVEYGLNVDLPGENRINEFIKIGRLIHHGDIKNTPIHLKKETLKTHTFICGVTGTGKTTTCQNILLRAELPFLVIEPAKTEYRTLANKLDKEKIYYFTLGNQNVAPFYINPFEIFEGESITSRVDMIKATMQSAFDMEAAMPQLIEAAAYDVYKRKGWNINNSTWINPDTNKIDDPFKADSFAFPTLSDYINSIELVTKEQGFGDKMEAEYLGSLKARLQALLVGAKGMMLNTPRSIDFKNLVKQKVVLELEDIKDGSEKSLLMGFIITNLLEAVKYQYKQNSKFQHITLIEEAHRLLSKYEPGDSSNKKRGVEVFADMLAEVRKYGESLIIVDQIPNKMTPEVLKNTNTKIVHKIFAQDDKDAIGNTLALNDEQKNFLSYLEKGRAIVITDGWKKPVQVQIELLSNTTGVPDISEDIIKRRIFEYYIENYKNGVLPGIQYFSDNISMDDIGLYFSFCSMLGINNNELSKIINCYKDYDNIAEIVGSKELEDLQQQLIKKIEKSSMTLNDINNKGIMNQYIYWLLGRLGITIRSDIHSCINELISYILMYIGKYTTLSSISSGLEKMEFEDGYKLIFNRIRSIYNKEV